MLFDLRSHVDTWEQTNRAYNDGALDELGIDNAAHLANAGEDLATVVRDMLAKPEYAQALALARLMSSREGQSFRVMPGPFDLPDGYVLVDFDGGQVAGGFTCGIAPNGDVSS